MWQNRIKQKTGELIAPLVLTGLAMTAGIILSSPHVSADNDSVVDKINIKVPISCTLSGTGMNTHNAEINNGQYNSNIGETTMKAFCNDNEGFAIYAIGYTDNANGKNVLTNSTLGSTHDIVTGTAISGSTSNWAMKLNTNSDPIPTYPTTIENSFDSFHAVPDTYTLVAKRTSGTDIGESAEGSTIQSTYQAYISPTQAAGTYTGQVKYTLIHPHDEPTPPDSMLDIGRVVNAKMKSLAAGASRTVDDQDKKVKSIRMATSLPVSFEPSEANTVSTPDSKYPIYIFFNNDNDIGAMYFYTENDAIIMNRDSSFFFQALSGLQDISGLIDWDASNVYNMNAMFYYDRSLESLHGLENWDTSNVTNMMSVFQDNKMLTDISALADWDLSRVITVMGIFSGDLSLASANAVEEWNTTNIQNMSYAFSTMPSLVSLDLSKWSTSKVKDMRGMFAGAKSLDTVDTTGWDTSKVTNMREMFRVGDAYAGNGQLREIIGVEAWDTSSVTDMTTMFYGAGQMTHYDIANWDVSKVESFNHMFCDNFKLESLDLSRWNVSSVKTMYNMFDDDRALTTIGDVSHWNTASLIDAGGWLNGATSFVGNNGTLDLSGWNTSNLKVAGEAFRATKLQTIDLSGWNFGSITNDTWPGTGQGIYYTTGNQETSYKALDSMFLNIPTLTNVYISQSGLDSFNTAVSNGVNTTNMWSGSGVSGFTVKP